jgi:hypothetical protein
MWKNCRALLKVWHPRHFLEVPRGYEPKEVDTLFVAPDGSVYEHPVEGVDVGVWVVYNDPLSRYRRLLQLQAERRARWGDERAQAKE